MTSAISSLARTNDTDNVAGGGIFAQNPSTGLLTLNVSGTNEIHTTGTALLLTNTGSTPNLTVLDVTGTNTFESGLAGPAVAVVGTSVSATQNSTVVSDFAGVEVIGNGTSGGVVFTDVTFDADPSNGIGTTAATADQVNFGTLQIGQSTAARVAEVGLIFNNTIGDVDLGTLNIFNDNGTGLTVNTQGTGTDFELTGGNSGTIDTTNGTAMSLDSLALDLTFGTVNSTNSTGSGVFVDAGDAVGGAASNALSITTLNVTGSANAGIDIQNSTGTFSLGTTTLNNAATAGGGVEVSTAAGDTATVNFNNGLDIDTSTGTGFSANGSAGTALTVTVANAGTETIDTTAGTAIDFDDVALNALFDSVSATHTSGSGIQLDNITGTLTSSGGTLANTGTGNAFDVGANTNSSGGDATVTYNGSITNTNNGGRSVLIQELAGGTINLGGNITDSGEGIRVRAINNGTTATVNFSGNLDVDNDVAGGMGIDLGSTGANTNGVINFTGDVMIDTQNTAQGFVGDGGMVSVAAAGTTTLNAATSGTGTALTLDGVTVGTAGITFDTVNSTGAATGIAVVTSLADAGTNGVTVTSSTITGGTTAAIDLAGTITAAVNFADLDIALNGDNQTGFDANGAVLNANVTATDFDLTSTSATGTTGVNLSGTTGTGTLTLGDTVSPFATGADATIGATGTAPNVGVQFSAATNFNFIFGDGEDAVDTDSIINATTPIAGGIPASGTYNFLDVPGAVNSDPVAQNQAYATFGNTILEVAGADIPGNEVAAVASAISLLTGATDTDMDMLMVQTATNMATTAGGTVTIFADGSFFYTPEAGDTGITDTFTFTVLDGNGGMDTATASITLTERIWYVDDDAAAGGDGTSATPFNSLAPLDTGGSSDGLDGTGDTIYVLGGTYSGGITLEDNQSLLGQAVDLVVGTTTLISGSAATRPTLANVGGSTVTLAAGNTVQGLAVGGGTGGGIIGSNVGTLLIDDVIFNPTGSGNIGDAIDVTNTTAGASLMIQNNIFNAANANAVIEVFNQATGATINITGNDINDSQFNSIMVENSVAGTAAVTISGNDIDADAVNNNGFGIQVEQFGSGSQTVLVDNNFIDGHSSSAVFLNSQGSGLLNATVTNNTNLTIPSVGCRFSGDGRGTVPR